MHTTSKWPSLCALFFAAPLAAVACGDTTQGANTAPQPTAAPTAEPSAAPTAEPTAAPTAEPTASAEPTAAPTTSASAAPDKPRSSGRPPLFVQGETAITETVGYSPGAKFELGDKEIATLRIPEGAFSQATNVTFAIDSKCKTTGVVFGKIYKLSTTVPPSATPASMPSNNGSKYTLMLPNGKKSNLNLALGSFGKDAKGNDTFTWKVIAPENAGNDASGLLEFQFDTLPDGCAHLTNKAPTY